MAAFSVYTLTVSQRFSRMVSAMPNLFPRGFSQLSVTVGLAAMILVFCAAAAHARQTITFTNGVPDEVAPTPMNCVRYLNARESEPVLPDASFRITAGEIQILAGGQPVFSIPAPVVRSQLISQNGQRPGTDYQYSADRASTGAGFYWFETIYPDATATPDVFRNELFIDGADKVVSYTYVEKRRIANAQTGAREATVRCEPAA